MSARVLVVEDERAIQLALGGLLKREGHDVEPCLTGDEGLQRARAGGYDLVLVDLSLGAGPDGMDVLRASREAHPDTPVVMLTAHGSEKVAVQAMKAGAEDYLPKPFDNDELRLVVARCLARTRLVREHGLLQERVAREQGLGALVGRGAAMNRVFEQLLRVAETDLTVLVRGESGTGKELVAQALHQRSARARRPFVAVNCAAIQRELVESELFGHEKGSFTGASARRVGRFEAADGGTLFLDEVGDMPLETQAKVLRALQERAIERVGGSRTLPVDVRVVAATHKDLEAEVSRGRFRQDLYYRLRVVVLQLPPLRQRLEDLPALAERFLGALAERLGRPRKALSEAALARLAAHPFPGNVRELRNALERAAVLCPSPVLGPEDLDLGDGPLSAPGGPLEPFMEARKKAQEAFDRAYLLRALRAHEGNITRTAEAIGVFRQTLQQRLRELAIAPEEWKET
ncbi:MAG: sigma-54-dependent Fis family transcriptional regulator [Deltaproteobacteria bacterium]|nr:sigma-54-dependent Fis family transcriptional regulator [Deltaproteobacteria bacterium]